MQALNELALRVEDDDLRASIEYTKGVTLAVSSGLFIGASFIIKKKGLLAAGESGLRAATAPNKTRSLLALVRRRRC